MHTHEKQKIRRVAGSILAAFIVVLVFRMFFDIAYVSGKSMEPVFYEGDILLLRKWGIPQNGDTVTAYIDERDEMVVKRVLAGEGDAVIIDNGNVYLNGKKVAEPVRGRQEESGRQEYILSPGQYFLIGENLEMSLDSRVFGQIEKSAVRGIVIGNLF